MAATHSSFSLVWIIFDPEGWRPYKCTRTLDEGEEHARIVVGTSCLAVRPAVNFASKRPHSLISFGVWDGVGWC